MAPSVLIHLSVVGEAALKYVTSQIIAVEPIDWSCQVLTEFAVERGFTNAFGQAGETLSPVVRKRRALLKTLVKNNELTVGGNMKTSCLYWTFVPE